MIKNGCGQSCDGIPKLTLSEKWTNWINWFLTCWCRFITVKSWLKIYWAGMVKNGCGQSNHGSLKYITDFLHASTNAGRLKVDSIIFECALSKMAVAF